MSAAIQYRANAAAHHGLLRAARSTIQKGHAVSHKFSVGQIVDLAQRMQRAAAPGCYEIVALRPESDRDIGDPSYRIKSIDEKHERIASESDLTLSAPAPAALV